MYNYAEEVRNDVREYIENEINLNDYDNIEELEEYLNDELFIEDSVTGNASGSYWFNSYRAAEALRGNIDLLMEALNEFGYGDMTLNEAVEKGEEWADVTIRCYLLGGAIADVLEEYEEEFENREEEEDEE